MEPTTYNLLEAMVRAVQAMARETACDEALKQDLTGKLTSVKVMMQRRSDEDVIPVIAETVIALTKFVTGLKPTTEPPVQRKHLLRSLESLRKVHESRERTREAVLHPSGRCECGGDGLCEWCKTHCVHCGAEADQHGPGSTHYFEPHGPDHTPDPEVAGEREENVARAASIGFTEETAGVIRENLEGEPEYELQHGGELREKEPAELSEPEVVHGGELDGKWIVISDGDVIVAALPDDTPEEMHSEMATAILAVWNEWQYGDRAKS